MVFVERIAFDDQNAEDVDSDRLVLAHQCGEESAFGELYLRYFDSVYLYARVALRDRHSAEDVAQQVFVNVLAALSRYEIRADRPFRAWLFRIAHNEVVDVVKRKQRVTGQDPAELDRRRDAADAAAVVAAPGTFEWLSDHELSLLVEQLPLAQRQLLTLRYLLDLSHEQIATILDKDPKALRKMSSRALRTLEARLASIGRTSTGRRVRDGMLVRLKPLPVLKARRFALGPPTRRRVA